MGGRRIRSDAARAFFKVAGADGIRDVHRVGGDSRGGEYVVLHDEWSGEDVWGGDVSDLTRPEHFSKWLAPTGFEMSIVSGEIREGASMLYYMTNGAVKMYGRATYPI